METQQRLNAITQRMLSIETWLMSMNKKYNFEIERGTDAEQKQYQEYQFEWNDLKSERNKLKYETNDTNKMKFIPTQIKIIRGADELQEAVNVFLDTEGIEVIEIKPVNANMIIVVYKWNHHELGAMPE